MDYRLEYFRNLLTDIKYVRAELIECEDSDYFENVVNDLECAIDNFEYIIEYVLD